MKAMGLEGLVCRLTYPTPGKPERWDEVGLTDVAGACGREEVGGTGGSLTWGVG